MRPPVPGLEHIERHEVLVRHGATITTLRAGGHRLVYPPPAMPALPAVPGFRFSGLSAGIKKDGRPDLALAVADDPATCAALYTRNRVVAAPVVVARDRTRRGRAQALLVNSGCANACTGAPGLRVARETTAAAARALKIDEKLVIPASTGVIGALLPAARVYALLPELVSRLASDEAEAFAHAILTTDQGPKTAHTTVKGRGGAATILGIAKGAGMIHPDMATTLAFVFTDAALRPPSLHRALRTAADRTFNAITVDGDTSTNDTLCVMASGRVSVPDARFLEGLTEVLDALATMIVADGEGAEHAVRIEVSGVASDAAARTVARKIALSPLVKTTIHGQDPNWGRILAAAGATNVPFDPDRAEIKIDHVVIVRKGLAVGPDAEAQAKEIMRAPRYTIHVRLGSSRGRAHYLTCDLGAEYVKCNAGYRS
jgi:glutamate N-acetyltransferase/amino-acid N-acetyltransferase